jgi:DNA-binding protein YbaB
VSTDPLPDAAARAEAEMRRQQEALAAATRAAQEGATTYEVDGGEIRVTVTGRLRLSEVYVSDRALRSGDVQDLVDAINGAIAAARDEYAQRLRAALDADTASLVTAAGTFLGPPAAGDAVPPPAADGAADGGPWRGRYR